MRKVHLDGFDTLKSAMGAADAGLRVCEAPGCEEAGEYRAPRAPDRLNDYYWFCLEHVRAYNKAWNYYAGLTESEIERQIQFDTQWQRATWPLGARIGGTARFRHHQQAFRDAFGVFEDEPRPDEEARRRMRGERPPNGPAEAALRTLDLDWGADAAEIKARYKELAKRYHPDANGGDKAAEERLKSINHAYAVLKKQRLI